MTSYQFSIRIATKKDIERIVDLWLESAAYHGELDPRLQVMQDKRASVQMPFEKDAKDEDVLLLVATIEEEVIGYFHAKVVSAPPVQRVSKIGFIDGMAVTEKHRRRGVGETLYRAALKWFKEQDISHVRVDVAFNNSEAQDVAQQRQSVHLTIVLFVAALSAPFMVGFQYLEWFHSSSSHMTWYIGIGIGSIESSDWMEGVWILRSVVSSGGIDPISVLGGLAIFHLPRLLFAAAISMYDAGKVGRYYVFVSALPVVFVTTAIYLMMMTANIILGIAPGVLYSIAAPDIDSRFFLPTPILIVLGLITVRSKGKK